MSLLNSLSSGVSGLRNHQTMMDVIGDNISNVNSIGYKGSRVTFSDTFSQFVRYGTNPTATTGGVNSYQVGLGAKLNSIDRDWAQGSLETTGINTDLALQGNGMFVLEKNGQRFFSRAGNFSFDSSGTLVNSGTGALVKGKMALSDGTIPTGNNLENIVIDPTMKLPAQATGNVVWNGNLSNANKVIGTEKIKQSGNINSDMTSPLAKTYTVYDSDGAQYTLTATYTKNTSASNTYDLTFGLKDSSGADVTISPSTASTVKFNSDGTLDTTNSTGAGKVTVKDTGATPKVNLSFDFTSLTQLQQSETVKAVIDDGKTSSIVSSSLNVFDSLGAAHNLTLKFTKTATNVWKWEASVPSASGTLSSNSGTITFNTDGSINTMSPAQPELTFQPTGGAAAQNIKLNFGTGFDGITQTSESSAVSPTSQDGSEAASLTSMNFDQYGKVVGVFSNGESKNLGQIMLANFTNLSGLINSGDNMYTVSANSGEARYGEPGEATGTTLQSGSLEQSNVDLSEEFTRMIVSQRGFQANARVISTADNMLQEITSLIR